MDNTNPVRLKGAGAVTIAAEIKETLKKTGEIALRIPNDGFAPTILKGDKIKAIKVNPDAIKKGHIVFLIKDGEILVRKVVKTAYKNEGNLVSLSNGKPDSEFSISSCNILGKVVEAHRGSQKITFEMDLSGSSLLSADLGSLIKQFFCRKT
jgi:hypothetical protein